MRARAKTGGYSAALLRLFAPLFFRRQASAPRGIENGGGPQDWSPGSRSGSGGGTARRIVHNGTGEYCSLEKWGRRTDWSDELLSGHYRAQAGGRCFEEFAWQTACAFRPA